MSVRVNGQAVNSVSALDRGLAYGDGLFETMRRVHGQFPLWARHMHRLADGCERLGLPLPDEAWLAHECRLAGGDLDDAVLRLTLTRGVGPRGYALPANPAATCIVSAAPPPKVPRDWYHHGVRLHLCRIRLAAQPQLAGIKHLNRLEQVLARSEWHDESLAEGLVRDDDDHVISATAANLFAVIDGVLATPALDQCGVAGVARAEVLASCDDVAVQPVAIDELADAEEIFLSSSVRGIVPVAAIPALGWRWSVGARSRELQAHWRDTGILPECGA